MNALLDTPRLTVPIGGCDHVRGPAVAPLTLLEYGDYECPYCGAAHVVLKELLAVMGDELTYAYRHFPLTQIHPHAQQAAEAAEAAGAQGRFWQMHDLLFEHHDRLTTRDLLGYAAALGLDVGQFALDLETHVHAPRVREDFVSGIRSGVNGTPTFFINGIRHNGGFDLSSMLAALREAAAREG
jgi:protein-disulfide isomerase